MSRFIGIDQSYSGFGFVAVDEHGALVDASLGNFPLGKFRHHTDRLNRIRNWLEIQYRGHKDANIMQVCLEGYANNAKFGREMAGELGAVVKLTTWWATGIDPKTVAPTQLKKYTLGKGVGGKNEMLLGVYKKWGEEFKNDNLADAFVLAQISRALHIHIDLPKYQDEVLQKICA